MGTNPINAAVNVLGTDDPVITVTEPVAEMAVELRLAYGLIAMGALYWRRNFGIFCEADMPFANCIKEIAMSEDLQAGEPCDF